VAGRTKLPEAAPLELVSTVPRTTEPPVSFWRAMLTVTRAGKFVTLYSTSVPTMPRSGAMVAAGCAGAITEMPLVWAELIVPSTRTVLTPRFAPAGTEMVPEATPLALVVPEATCWKTPSIRHRIRMDSLARKPETLMVTASPRSTMVGVSRNRGVMVKPLRETMLPATTKRTSLAPPTMVGTTREPLPTPEALELIWVACTEAPPPTKKMLTWVFDGKPMKE
jgi:hypothetical protein